MKIRRLVSVFAVTGAIAVTSCDANADGVDDTTGERVPITVSYSWTGQQATIVNGGTEDVRDTPSGTGYASVVVQPGTGSSIAVTGFLAYCQATRGGRIAAEWTAPDSVNCTVSNY